MLDMIKKLYSLLKPREKRNAFILLVMMVAGAGLEIIGIGLIMPVIALLSKPELIHQNKYLKMVYDFVQPSDMKNFICILCLILIVLYIGKNLFMAILTRLQIRFIFNKITSLANELYENYLNAPYTFHLQKNSAHLLNNLNMIVAIGQGVMMPLMLCVTEIVIITLILAMLLVLSPLATLMLALASAIITALLYFPFRNFNHKLGVRLRDHGNYVFQYVMQGFDGIKECKVRNCEGFFCDEQSIHRREFNKAMIDSTFLGNLPRFLIEGFVITLGLLMLIVLVITGKATGSILLILSLFALSMLRLMPSLSRVQFNLSKIRQSSHLFDTLYDDLINREFKKTVAAAPPLNFEKSIEIKKLNFSYGPGQEKIFEDFSLTIGKNESVAFVGPTGGGKTTLVDIILGLLKPERGGVYVDGRDIGENIESWQLKIGYVPQLIFLLDGTIRANVAFGVKTEDIDDQRVIACLKMAQAWDFVEKQSAGLDLLVGEKGMRLSGGQRQRIGIARALYHNPELLVLDEATSALDNETEKAFIDAVNNLKGKLTIIMIAHRLSTTEKCDKIIRIGQK